MHPAVRSVIRAIVSVCFIVRSIIEIAVCVKVDWLIGGIDDEAT